MGLLEFNHLTVRQTEFVSLAKHLAQNMASQADAFDRNGELPLPSFTELKQSAYPKLTVPKAFGGLGANLLEFVLAQICLSQGDAAVALTAAMNAHVIGGVSASGAWNAEISNRIFKEVVSRGALINALASEPELGSPSRGGAFRTVAEKVVGGWRLTGRKNWTTGGTCLDFFVVHASLIGVLEPTGRMIVPVNTDGVRFERTWVDALSLRSSAADDVVFESVFVPDSHFIVPTAPSSSGTAWFWAAMSATYLGIGIAALKEVVQYAKTRVPTALGKPISSLTNVQQKIGLIELTLKAAQTMLLETCEHWVTSESRDELMPALAGAKYLCTNAAVTATDLALRVAGGNALTRSLTLERHFRDARAGLVHPPNDETTLEMIGRARLEQKT
jgi:alkylation response protein AidB-like acyl-CoA dehydrogenase